MFNIFYNVYNNVINLYERLKMKKEVELTQDDFDNAIRDIVLEWDKAREIYIKKYEIVKGNKQYIDIYNRDNLSNQYKDNNCININYAKKIVKTKANNFKHVVVSTNDKKLQTILNDINRSNSMNLKNDELIEDACIGSYSGRLAFINTNGKMSFKNYKAYEFITVGQHDDGSYDMAIVFNTRVEKIGMLYQQIIDVTVYTATSIIDYEYNYNSNKIVRLNEIPNFFQEVPLLKLKNNAEETNDFDDVLDLINAINRLYTDNDNLLEQTKNALLVLQKLNMSTLLSGDSYKDTEDERRKKLAKAIKDLNVIITEENGDAKFVKKEIDVESIKYAIEQARKFIYEIAGIPDFSSEEIKGQVTGVALEIKYRELDKACEKLQERLKELLTNQYRLVLKYINFINNTNYNYLDINIDADLDRIINKQEVTKDILDSFDKGVIPKEIVIKKLYFLTDKEKEDLLLQIEKEKEEQKKNINVIPNPNNNTNNVVNNIVDNMDKMMTNINK